MIERALLKIYADFNSGGNPGQGPCWLLRYGENFIPLDEVATQLDLKDGMKVILFYREKYKNLEENFEVEGILQYDEKSYIKWKALPDWSTYKER